jgi:transposase
VDVHQNSYTVARMLDNSTPQPSQTMSPTAFLDLAKKQRTLAKRVVVAYEAGPLGFHLQRQLTALGIECLVVAPQDWYERHKRVKTDKVDAREIVLRLDRYLAGNTKALAVVRVPTLAEEVARDLSRERQQLKQDRQRLINRGHSLLRKYGLGRVGRWWEDEALEPLAPQLKEQLGGDASAETLVQSLIGQLGDYAELIEQLAVRVADLTKTLEQAGQQRKRPRIKGVGPLSQEILQREICDWSRFQNRRQVASYTGLCPGRHASGGRSLELSVSKCGNPRVRAVLTELAWLMVRFQPNYVRLKRWQEVLAHGTGAMKKKAITALARQLAVDLWRIYTGRVKAEQLGLEWVA